MVVRALVGFEDLVYEKVPMAQRKGNLNGGNIKEYGIWLKAHAWVGFYSALNNLTILINHYYYYLNHLPLVSYLSYAKLEPSALAFISLPLKPSC